MASVGPPEALLNRAHVKVSQRDLASAFELYVQAAQSFLHLSRTLPAASPDKVRYRSKAKEALEWAEKVKSSVGQRPALVTPSGPLEEPGSLRPIKRDRLSKEEQFAVLDRSASVNGLRFLSLVNKDKPDSRRFQGKLRFLDPDGYLSLSPAQAADFGSWISATDLSPTIKLVCQDDGPEDILQDVVTDCSVVASLSVCWGHHRRFGSQLPLSGLHPQNAEGDPYLSDNGMYAVHLLFNGAVREVGAYFEPSSAKKQMIDDQLPRSRDGRLLCAYTRDNRSLWPSLIEKAYLKLMGGYEFIGSDTSIDLHALIGWIPDHILLKTTAPGSLFQAEREWARIKSGFDRGHCIVTLGTGPIVPSSVNLIAEHCYALIDLMEDQISRKLRLANPWNNSCSFWIEWDDACDAFNSVYLSWDPKLFKNIQAVHSTWRKDELSAVHQILEHQTQVVFDNDVAQSTSSSRGGAIELWALLTRHVTSTTPGFVPEYIALKACQAAGGAGFDRRDLAGSLVYTDSPHTLVRLDVDHRNPFVSLFALREIDAVADGDKSETSSLRATGYTITVFSNIAFHFADPFAGLAYSKTVESSFTTKTAGGHPGFRTFMHNPQYSLQVKRTPLRQSSSDQPTENTKLRITLVGVKDIPYNVKVVWGAGRRVTDISQGDIVADSGPYTYGLTSIISELQPDVYTIVCTTFGPGQVGPFTLAVDSSGPIDIATLPNEGAGMFSKSVSGSWRVRPSGYIDPQEAGHDSARVEINVTGPTKLTFRLQSISEEPLAHQSISLGIFKRGHDGSLGHQIVTTGPHNSATSGVATPLQAFEGPATYIAIPSTLDRDSDTHFELVMYSSRNTADMTISS